MRVRWYQEVPALRLLFKTGRINKILNARVAAITRFSIRRIVRIARI
jgi:hypothetical protein